MRRLIVTTFAAAVLVAAPAYAVDVETNVEEEIETDDGELEVERSVETDGDEDFDADLEADRRVQTRRMDSVDSPVPGVERRVHEEEKTVIDD